MADTLLLAFDGRTTYSFGRLHSHSYSVFGGPFEFKVVGKRFRQVRLHQIARLAQHHLPLLNSPSRGS